MAAGGDQVECPPDDPAVEVADEAEALGGRDELAGGDRAAADRVEHPDQQLLGARESRRHVDDRLRVEDEAALLDGLADVADPLEAAAVLAREDDGAVAAGFLRLVDRDVGRGDQVGGAHSHAALDQSDTGARGEVGRPGPGADHRQQAAGALERLGLADAGDQHPELVAVETGEEVAGAHLIGEHLRDVGDDAIAGAAPEGVVDPLQVVEVDDHHRAALARQAARAEHPVDGRLEGATVHQARELVVFGEVAEPVLGRLLLADVGDQALDDHHPVLVGRAGGGPVADPDQLAAAPANPVGDVEGRPLARAAVLRLEHPLEVVGMHRPLPEVGVGHDLLRGPAGDLLDLRRDEVPLSLRAETCAVGDRGQALDQGADLPLRVGERLDRDRALDRGAERLRQRDEQADVAELEAADGLRGGDERAEPSGGAGDADRDRALGRGRLLGSDGAEAALAPEVLDDDRALAPQQRVPGLGGGRERHDSPGGLRRPAGACPERHRVGAFVAAPELAAVDAELVDDQRDRPLQQVVHVHSLERDLAEVEGGRPPARVGVELALALAALAGVVEVDGEPAGVVELDRLGGDVDGNLASVGPARGKLDPPLTEALSGLVDLSQQHRADGGLEVVGEDQAGELLAERARALEAELRLGRLVPVDDQPGPVDDRDPVRGSLEQGHGGAAEQLRRLAVIGAGGADVGEPEEPISSPCTLLFGSHPPRLHGRDRRPYGRPRRYRQMGCFPLVAGRLRADRERVDGAVVHPLLDRGPDHPVLVDARATHELLRDDDRAQVIAAALVDDADLGAGQRRGDHPLEFGQVSRHRGPSSRPRASPRRRSA